MPLTGDRIKVGRCYGMIIGGKPIIAKVIQIYPLNISVSQKPDSLRDGKSAVTENIIRWAWWDAIGLGKWTESPGWLLPAFALAAQTEVECDSCSFHSS